MLLSPTPTRRFCWRIVTWRPRQRSTYHAFPQRDHASNMNRKIADEWIIKDTLAVFIHLYSRFLLLGNRIREIEHRVSRCSVLHRIYADRKITHIDALEDAALRTLMLSNERTNTRGSCQLYSQLSSGPLDITSIYWVSTRTNGYFACDDCMDVFMSIADNHIVNTHRNICHDSLQIAVTPHRSRRGWILRIARTVSTNREKDWWLRRFWRSCLFLLFHCLLISKWKRHNLISYLNI